MITKMILITVLILAILFATWVKDKEEMNPPFKRRLIIDLTVIFSLWVLYAVFFFTKTPSTSDIAETVINVGLLYFVGQFVYLIAKISPMFAGLVKLLKKDGVNIPEVVEEEKEDKKRMNITNAGVRGHNPTGVVIHNDAGSNGANTNFYNNWLPKHNPEEGFAHVYIASDGQLQASDFSNMAWHCANSYGNTNYASWEVCQSEGDLNQFLKNEQAVLDDVAKYMKQWGLIPNRDTVKLHQELSSTSCPRRSVEVHGGTLESCRSYFITELNKRITGQTKGNTEQPTKTEEEEIEMYLIQALDDKTRQPKFWYISNGISIRHIETIRFLDNYRTKYGNLNLRVDSAYVKEIEAEFGIKIKNDGRF